MPVGSGDQVQRKTPCVGESGPGCYRMRRRLQQMIGNARFFEQMIMWRQVVSLLNAGFARDR